LSQLLSKVTVASCRNVYCVRLTAGRRTLKMCCYRSSIIFN